MFVDAVECDPGLQNRALGVPRVVTAKLEGCFESTKGADGDIRCATGDLVVPPTALLALSALAFPTCLDADIGRGGGCLPR